MYQVDVSEYCQDCEEFEPKVYTSVTYFPTDWHKVVRHNICCRHADRCQAIHEHAVKVAMENNDDEE